jgi:hypothetical protein
MVAAVGSQPSKRHVAGSILVSRSSSTFVPEPAVQGPLALSGYSVTRANFKFPGCDPERSFKPSVAPVDQLLNAIGSACLEVMTPGPGG